MCISNVGEKKPGFLRLASGDGTARYVEDVLLGNVFRNRVSQRSWENRVSGKALVDADANLWSPPLSHSTFLFWKPGFCTPIFPTHAPYGRQAHRRLHRRDAVGLLGGTVELCARGGAALLHFLLEPGPCPTI